MATNIDRAFLRAIKPEITALLAEFAAHRGITITVASGGKYGGTTGSISLELATIGEDGKATSEAAESFKLNATAMGLKVEDLGRSFDYGGHRYTIVGCKPESWKYPVLAERPDGRRFKLPADGVVAALAREAA